MDLKNINDLWDRFDVSGATEMELEMQAYLRVKGKKRHEVAPSDWALYEAYMKRRGAK